MIGKRKRDCCVGDDAALVEDSFTRLGRSSSFISARVKMASSFWKGVVGVGLLALAHAAFSAAQRKYYSFKYEVNAET